jgi:hypothetical protein
MLFYPNAATASYVTLVTKLLSFHPESAWPIYRFHQTIRGPATPECRTYAMSVHEVPRGAGLRVKGDVTARRRFRPGGLGFYSDGSVFTKQGTLLSCGT